MRRIIRERERVTAGWRQLCNEEFNNLYFSPQIIWVIKSTRIKWAAYIHCTGERRKAYNFFARKSERKKQLVKLRLCRRVILK
jgi:hypothetical protein